ncbi:fungal-specific transcription factor domain-containing protein [Colletotrichum godetiae]|uniref:Fungal-specific transcription factor domain-containing protein n=1 Tax=Colletotrichum godetiae TaxID=1209918 RepID=A0AAJ0B1Y1_9PEZI|nr:fungal-specific transcription factor domain-containing protein [Colletotrichum godetiae]KAK1700192.1 fungal-specific transcription factor domain-containing protein [Colletotrichum godetiae]
MQASRPFRTRRQTPRVSKACRQCRAGRVKCDGAKPQCGTCARQSRHCDYNAVDGRKQRHTEAEFAALSSRVAFLEAQLNGNGLLAHNDSQISHQDEEKALPSMTEDHEPHFDGKGEGNVVYSTPERWQIDSLFPTSDFVTQSQSLPLKSFASITGGFLHDGKSGRIFYVGPTSNLHIAKATASCLPTSKLATAATKPRELPDLPENDELVDCYWEYLSPHLILHESQSEVQLVIRQNCLLLIAVLAVGAFFLRKETYDRCRLDRNLLIEFYLRRFTIVSGRETENATILNIQAFLLRSYLAIMQGKTDSATIFLGIACNMAKVMGLHVNPASGSDYQPILSTDSETSRKRTFWACFWMDRRLAMLEGRAVHLTACDISVESPARDFLHQYSESSGGQATQEMLYAVHLEFADMQDRSLCKIYSFSSSSSVGDAISDGNLRYITWLKNLPPTLRNTKKSEHSLPSFMSLHLCYHAGMILLHRPSFQFDGEQDRLANSPCLESAYAISGLLKAYREQFSNLVVDFMVLHAAFTGALVHMIMLEHPAVASYHKSMRALRAIIDFLGWVIPHSQYARSIHQDLQNFASTWSIKPINSAIFWET